MNTLNFKEFIEFVKENILEPDKLTIGVNWAKNHLSQATNDKPCIWQQDLDDEWNNWNTECGETYCLEAETPKKNKMNFCCYCGKRLEERLA